MDGHNSTIHNNEVKIIKLFAKANLYNTKTKIDSYLKLVDQMDVSNNNWLNADIIPEIKKYNTSRIDIKNEGGTTNNIELLKVSDKKSEIFTPDWFSDEQGVGYLIESNVNNLTIKLKCINDGKLKILLRSKYVTDKNKNNFPVHIEYTNFTVNNEIILNNPKLVHCFKPIEYTKNVKDNEIIHLNIQWVPFNSKSEIV